MIPSTISTLAKDNSQYKVNKTKKYPDLETLTIQVPLEHHHSGTVGMSHLKVPGHFVLHYILEHITQFGSVKEKRTLTSYVTMETQHWQMVGKDY